MRPKAGMSKMYIDIANYFTMSKYYMYMNNFKGTMKVAAGSTELIVVVN